MSGTPYLSCLLVENLVVIERAELRLHPGLNVLTGETGAGKTVLAKGLDLLLGGRATKAVVRPQSRDAYVQGTWSVPDGWLRSWTEGHSSDVLANLVDPDVTEITLARRIASSGRTSCFVNGRTFSLDGMRVIAANLISFYGQHEQRQLAVESAQAGMLDRSGDGHGSVLAAVVRDARRLALSARARHRELVAAERDQAREADLVRFELEELDRANVTSGEPSKLERRLRDLQDAQEGRNTCEAAVAGIDGDAGVISVVDAALHRMSRLTSSTAEALTQRLRATLDDVQDLATDLRSAAAGWDDDPQELSEIEQRLAELLHLARKHRCDPDDLPSCAARIRERVQELDDLPTRAKIADDEAGAAEDRAVKAAGALTQWRCQRAPKLGAEVASALTGLAFDGADFEVLLQPLDGDTELQRIGERGAEHVSFRLQPGPGLPLAPLAKVASGGELSRVMLALVSECGDGNDGTLVLDEPDTGIGGHTANGVAERLVELSESRQIVVISHLPQIAALADRHFVISKSTTDTATTTTIEDISDEQSVLAELVRMGGHDYADQDALAAAARLRARRTTRPKTPLPA